MKKVYLVDSENVGDVWVPLLVSAKEEEGVVVFYTQRSPHMNYENVRMLKETDKEAAFIKCFEGNNALDFQLVSELGYHLCKEPDCDYIIVSNDTGFDAVVKYWAAKGMPVSRLSGKECFRMLKNGKTQTAERVESQPETVVLADAESQGEESAQKEDAPQQAEAAQKAETAQKEEVPQQEEAAQKEEVPQQEESAQQEEAHVSPEDVQAVEPEEKSERVSEDHTKPEAVDTVIRELQRCITRDNLVDFHNALVSFFGEEQGKELYLQIKGDSEYSAYWSTQAKCSQKEKFDIYCHIVFAHSEYAKEEPEDFATFLYQANGKRKNLNSLRAALIGHYGKDKGMKYYSLFRSHIKIMNRM